MYQAGTWVMYGVHGVCRVIGTEKQMVNRKRATFLVLEPLAQSESRFYLPVENTVVMAKLREVLTPEDLKALLNSEEIRLNVWIHEENRRKVHYRELICSGDRLALLQMIHSLYRYKEEQIAAGRKFHQSDDNFLRDAEKLIASEISLVMGLSAEDARNYLRAQLKGA